MATVEGCGGDTMVEVGEKLDLPLIGLAWLEWHGLALDGMAWL